MSYTLHISNLDTFCDFLSASLKIIQTHKFVINQKGCNISAVDVSSTVRAYLDTPVMTSDTEVVFCLNETSKLYRALSKIKELMSTSSVTLEFDSTFLTYNDNGFKFKLSTIAEKTIKNFICPALTRNFDITFGVDITPQMSKQLISLSSICSADTTKLYMYKDGDNIIAELDDKVSAYTDSISIPISQKYFGDWTKPFAIKLDTFKLFNVLPTNEITINMTTLNALDVYSKCHNINLRIVTSILK